MRTNIIIVIIFIVVLCITKIYQVQEVKKVKSITKDSIHKKDTCLPMDTINIIKPYWIEMIKRTEGLVLHVYKCPAGYPTIGYGHMLKRGEHFKTITNKQADSLLYADFEFCINAVPDTFHANARLALARFIYGAGIGTFNSVIKQINKDPSIILKTCSINGKVNKALLRERTFEYNQIIKKNV